MPPDPTDLIRIADIKIPLVGFYDAPFLSAFEPLVEPGQNSHGCVFAYFKKWLKGQTLHLSRQSYGCRGAGRHLCGVDQMTRENMVKFLVDEEGLKASHDLMNRWLDASRPYRLEHDHLFIGPMREEAYEYLKSVTFFVNPDQLALLMLGAQYYSAPEDQSPILARFGSGCMQMVTLFDDLNLPQAVIAATDIAMRSYLSPDILAFTVTKSMFERLCGLDEQSFLYKPFWKRLQEARE